MARVLDPIQIITQARYNEGDTATQRLVFDAVVSLSSNKTKRLTSYPISDKSVITNHAVQNNDMVSMSAWISQTPVDSYDGNLIGYTDLAGRTIAAEALLNKWKITNETLFLMNTDFGDITNLQLISVVPTAVKASSVMFSLEFEKVRRATYQRAILTTGLDRDKTRDGSPSTTKGGSVSVPADDNRSELIFGEILRIFGSDVTNIGIQPLIPNTGGTP